MSPRVYIAHAPELGLVKIGCSQSNLRKRIRHLQTECGYRARLVTVMRGDFKRERALHRRFSAHAVGHEWFRPEGKLAAFLEAQGAGHILGRPMSAVLIGRMKRRYTIRLKRARAQYQVRWGKGKL